MKHLIEESRDPSFAHWTAAVALALWTTGCVASHLPGGTDVPGGSATADLVAEVDALASELTKRASLRIPLGSARVLVEHPLAVRPERNRHWPEHSWAKEQHAAQAALEFELEIALGSRMNVVGARSHALTSGTQSAPALTAHTVRAEHAGATHALLTTFLYDGFELDLTVQLVALDSRWIIATARRRIFGYSPDAYDAPLGAAVAESTAARGREVADAAEQVPAIPTVVSAMSSVALVPTLVERTAPEPVAPPGERVASSGDDGVPLVAVEGPAAMRRRALERIANEVAARSSEGVDSP